MADGLFGADLGLTGPPTALLVAANLAFLAVLTAVALLALPRLLAARAARS